MPGTVVQELLRILRSRKRQGEKNIWLSTVNQEAMQRLAAGFHSALPKNAVSGPPSRPMPRPAPQTVSMPSPDENSFSRRRMPAPVQGAVPQAAAAVQPSGSPVAQAAAPSRQSQRQPISGDYQSCASLDYEGLSAKVSSCQLCQLCRNTPHGLFGEGVPGSRVMFIGGHASSLDPATPAGVMVTKIITAMMKMARGGEDPATGVYVTSVLKCSAAGIRLTDSREVECCMGHLQRQIELVHPEYIVLLGALPMRCLLGLVNVQKFHGQWFEYKGIPVLPVYEPEYILRFQNQPSFFMKYKRELWNDLKQLMQKLNPAPKS